MAINYKIKELFRKTGNTMMGVAAKKGICFQSLSRKINHGKFTIDELCELAELTGCQLSCFFVLPDGERLYLQKTKTNEEENIDYRWLLIEKVRVEYDVFLEELSRLSTNEILDKSYEKIFKEELVIAIESNQFTQIESKALYFDPKPLDRIYKDWVMGDLSCLDTMKKSIGESVKKAVKEMDLNKRGSR